MSFKKRRFQEQWWKQPKNVLRRTNASGLESKQNIGRVNQKGGKKKIGTYGVFKSYFFFFSFLMLMAVFQFELQVLEKCVNCCCPEPYFGGVQKHCCGDTFKMVLIQPLLAIAKMSLLLLLLIGLINLCPALSFSSSVSVQSDSPGGV